MKLICRNCKQIHRVKKTPEIPSHINTVETNWCIDCQDEADEPYEEFYIEDDKDEKINDPNQLNLFS